MKNSAQRINLDVDAETPRSRGRPKGAVTKDRALRQRLTVALVQSIIRGADANEPVSAVESALFQSMTKLDGQKYLGSSGSGKNLRRYLEGSVTLSLEGLKALSKAGRKAGFLLTSTDAQNHFLGDLETPDHFNKVREARAKIEIALGNLKSSAAALSDALTEANGLAVIDQEGLNLHSDMCIDALDLPDVPIPQFDPKLLVYQLEHLFASPADDCRRAKIPSDILIKNGWYTGLRIGGPMKNEWQ